MESGDAGIHAVLDMFDWFSIPQALDQIRDPLVIADAEGKIVYWNQSAEQTLLVPREEALGQRISDVVRMDAEPARRSVIEDAVQDRASWDRAFWLRRRDGMLLNLCITRSIIRDHNGRSPAWW